jgi:hypothetical protein
VLVRCVWGLTATPRKIASKCLTASATTSSACSSVQTIWLTGQCKLAPFCSLNGVKPATYLGSVTQVTTSTCARGSGGCKIFSYVS